MYEVNIRFRKSGYKMDYGKVPRGFSDTGYVLNKSYDIENRCSIFAYVIIDGCTLRTIKNKLSKDNSFTRLYFYYEKCDINTPIEKYVYMLCGDYIIRYKINRCSWSELLYSKNADYVADKIYKHNNNSYILIAKTFKVQEGLDEEIIEQIISECTEI